MLERLAQPDLLLPFSTDYLELSLDGAFRESNCIRDLIGCVACQAEGDNYSQSIVAKTVQQTFQFFVHGRNNIWRRFSTDKFLDKTFDCFVPASLVS